jgi:hypothetical protein
MDEVEAWRRSLTEDTLIVSRVHDEVTRAQYQPCSRTVDQVIGPENRGPLELYARTLAEFDERDNSVTLYPLNTRPGTRFLRPKYPSLERVVVEMLGPIAVETEADAEAVFDDLPDGLIKDWRWGLGIHRLFEPIFHIVQRVDLRPGDDPLDEFETSTPWRSLRLSRRAATHIAPAEYVLHLSDFARLRFGLQKIQNDHRERALSERMALTHNTLLATLDPQAYPFRTAKYKPDTVYSVLHAEGAPPKLSRRDTAALLGAVGDRAKDLSREAPEQVSAMINAVQVANLDHLIERFQALYERKHSLEKEWQALLGQNRFLLSMVFGYPVVLVKEQAGVGVSNLAGANARFADFLLKNPVTNSAASDLVQAVMQIVNQRFRLLTHLTLHQSDGHEIEGWSVGCVVIAGRDPEDKATRKAFDLYRQSLKDVVVLTYGELLARLVGLRDFLSAPPAEAAPVDLHPF